MVIITPGCSLPDAKNLLAQQDQIWLSSINKIPLSASNTDLHKLSISGLVDFATLTIGLLFQIIDLVLGKMKSNVILMGPERIVSGLTVLAANCKAVLKTHTGSVFGM